MARPTKSGPALHAMASPFSTHTCQRRLFCGMSGRPLRTRLWHSNHRRRDLLSTGTRLRRCASEASDSPPSRMRRASLRQETLSSTNGCHLTNRMTSRHRPRMRSPTLVRKAAASSRSERRSCARSSTRLGHEGATHHEDTKARRLDHDGATHHEDTKARRLDYDGTKHHEGTKTRSKLMSFMPDRGSRLNASDRAPGFGWSMRFSPASTSGAPATTSC